jgi:hypothetical protein
MEARQWQARLRDLLPGRCVRVLVGEITGAAG